MADDDDLKGTIQEGPPPSGPVLPQATEPQDSLDMAQQTLNAVHDSLMGLMTRYQFHVAIFTPESCTKTAVSLYAELMDSTAKFLDQHRGKLKG
jgi:hypothetical protein